MRLVVELRKFDMPEAMSKTKKIVALQLVVLFYSQEIFMTPYSQELSMP